MKITVLLCQVLLCFALFGITKEYPEYALSGNNVIIDSGEAPLLGVVKYPGSYIIYFEQAYSNQLVQTWENEFFSVFSMARIRSRDAKYNELINDTLSYHQTYWITNRESHYFDPIIPVIMCHSDKYLSLFTGFENYTGMRTWIIEEGITIDMYTGNRVFLADIISDFEQLVHSIKYGDAVFRVSESERYEGYEVTENTMRSIRDITNEEMESMLDDCSKVITDYNYDTSAGELFAKSTFYLEEGLLGLVLKRYPGYSWHIIIDISKIQDNLKVPMW